VTGCVLLLFAHASRRGRVQINSRSFRDVCRLSALEDKSPRRIFIHREEREEVTEGWRKSYNEKFPNIYSSPYVRLARLLRSRAGHILSVTVLKAHRTFPYFFQRWTASITSPPHSTLRIQTDPDSSTLGKPRHRMEDNIKMYSVNSLMIRNSGRFVSTLCSFAKKKKLRGFSPQANYTDPAIAAGQRS
jgi:hypothetical protein